MLVSIHAIPKGEDITKRVAIGLANFNSTVTLFNT